MENSIDNLEPTKGRKLGNPAWHKGMPSANPFGAPRRGEGWNDLFNEIGNMTYKQVMARFRRTTRKLSKLKKMDGVTMKEFVVLRVFEELMKKPDPRLLVAAMNRSEGAPPQTHTVILTWREKLERAGFDPDEVVQQVEQWLDERSAETAA